MGGPDIRGSRGSAPPPLRSGPREGAGGIPRHEHLAWPEGFAATPGDRRALLVLLSLAALTPRRLLELAAARGTAAACLDSVRAGLAGSEGDRRVAASLDPAGVAARVAALGARMISAGDPDYPPQLLDLFDPPAGLFIAGSPIGAGEPRVAVVGARRCRRRGARWQPPWVEPWFGGRLRGERRGPGDRRSRPSGRGGRGRQVRGRAGLWPRRPVPQEQREALRPGPRQRGPGQRIPSGHPGGAVPVSGPQPDCGRPVACRGRGGGRGRGL